MCGKFNGQPVEVLLYRCCDMLAARLAYTLIRALIFWYHKSIYYPVLCQIISQKITESLKLFNISRTNPDQLVNAN